MYQCCKTCKHLKIEMRETGTIEVAWPSCPFNDFSSYTISTPGNVSTIEIAPDDSDSMATVAHHENFIQIGNKYFRPRFTSEEYTTKETPRSVERLLETSGFQGVDVPRISEEEMEEIRKEASGVKEIVYLMSEEDYNESLMELADDDIEPEDQPWHEFSAGNRNNVYYEYLGSFFDAYFEPLLWSHACEHGLHRFTGSIFTDEVDITGRHLNQLTIEKVAKVFYAEMTVKEKVIKSCACGLPMDENEISCPFCKGDEDVSLYYQKATGLVSSLDFATVSVLDSTIENIAKSLKADSYLAYLKEM